MSTELIRQCMAAYFYFMIYSFGGWVVQGIWVGFKDGKFENTGFYRGPWVPIFGWGCLLILYIIDPISPNMFWVFFNSFFFTSVLEYFISWYLQKRFHRLWWNYSNKPFNIHGRVCLLNSLMYGLAGVVITYFVQPYIAKLYWSIPYSIAAIIETLFSLVFFSDVIITNAEMSRNRKALENIHNSLVRSIVNFNDKVESDIDQLLQKNLEIMERSSSHIKRFKNQKLDPIYVASIEKAKAITKRNKEFLRNNKL